MEVETNTAQVEALMNLIRSTYPQIVQELSQLSNSVSDGEPPWKKQRINKTYANNENRGESKNVLGDVYKYSVVNNINLSFNFTLANGNPGVQRFHATRSSSNDREAGSDRPTSKHAPDMIRESSIIPHDVMVVCTAPEEVLTDAQLLLGGIRARTRLFELHRRAAAWSSRHTLQSSLDIETLPVKGKYVSGIGYRAVQSRSKDFFTIGRIFGMAVSQASIEYYHSFIYSDWDTAYFLVVRCGQFSCEVIPVLEKVYTSDHVFTEDDEYHGILYGEKLNSRSTWFRFEGRALQVCDVDERKFGDPRRYDCIYDAVYSVDYHIHASAAARIAEDSLDDLKHQFDTVWRRKAERQRLPRRNSTLA